jgi:UDP-GlcNAc:undecaprenyl-phosphate GlcNAc-1-phosphate transferase
MAVMATLPHFSNRNFPHRWAVLLPLLVLAVPLLDLVWVVILRTSMGKPFYVGDTNHLSHRLVRRGYSKTSAVLLIWLLSVIVGSAALSLVLFFD